MLFYFHRSFRSLNMLKKMFPHNKESVSHVVLICHYKSSFSNCKIWIKTFIIKQILNERLLFTFKILLDNLDFLLAALISLKIWVQTNKDVQNLRAKQLSEKLYFTFLFSREEMAFAFLYFHTVGTEYFLRRFEGELPAISMRLKQSSLKCIEQTPNVPLGLKSSLRWVRTNLIHWFLNEILPGLEWMDIPSLTFEIFLQPSITQRFGAIIFSYG